MNQLAKAVHGLVTGKAQDASELSKEERSAMAQVGSLLARSPLHIEGVLAAEPTQEEWWYVARTPQRLERVLAAEPTQEEWWYVTRSPQQLERVLAVEPAQEEWWYVSQHRAETARA